MKYLINGALFLAIVGTTLFSSCSKSEIPPDTIKKSTSYEFELNLNEIKETSSNHNSILKKIHEDNYSRIELISKKDSILLNYVEIEIAEKLLKWSKNVAEINTQEKLKELFIFDYGKNIWTKLIKYWIRLLIIQ